MGSEGTTAEQQMWAQDAMENKLPGNLFIPMEIRCIYNTRFCGMFLFQGDDKHTETSAN